MIDEGRDLSNIGERGRIILLQDESGEPVTENERGRVTLIQEGSEGTITYMTEREHFHSLYLTKMQVISYMTKKVTSSILSNECFIQGKIVQ